VQQVVDIDDRHLRRTLERVEAVVAAVEADDVLAPQPGEHCRRCDYTAYCPTQRAEPLPVPSSGPKGQLALPL
jgi:CRISPR/Cas system-associated exonuclease Cas4 (RecB family)